MLSIFNNSDYGKDEDTSKGMLRRTHALLAELQSHATKVWEYWRVRNIWSLEINKLSLSLRIHWSDEKHVVNEFYLVQVKDMVDEGNRCKQRNVILGNGKKKPKVQAAYDYVEKSNKEVT